MSTTENTRRNLPGEKFRPMPTETKASIKTTELFFYLGAVLAVVTVTTARDLRQPPPRVRKPQLAPIQVRDDDETRERVSA